VKLVFIISKSKNILSPKFFVSDRGLHVLTARPPTTLNPAQLLNSITANKYLGAPHRTSKVTLQLSTDIKTYVHLTYTVGV
jgi:hypothetical protein